jgi:cysteine-rich repeat protein
MDTHCPDVYGDDATCQVACENFPSDAETGSTEGNSLQCRIYHGTAAEMDPALHCAHAGPFGGGVCGDYCELYCDIMEANCSESYPDRDTCLNTCDTFPADGVDGDTDGDSVQCRMYHGVVAASDAVTHCPHASATGGGVCGSYCDVYCGLMGDNCGDTYADEEACQAACADLSAEGSAGDVDGNSVQCRIYHAGVPAVADAAVHCPHSGELGGGVCGTYCDYYCDQMDENCPESYADRDSCQASCALFPADAPEGSIDGNSVQCRIYHGGAPATADGALHCPHASAGGGDVCGSYCDVYCGLMASNCEGTYADDAECQAACADLSNEGNDGDFDGNSVQCRIYHAGIPASLDADVHCPHADEVGGDVCGTYCDYYCDQMEANCSDSYEDRDDCMFACSMLPQTGTLGDVDGDTLQCRIYHGGDPAASEPATHCPHANFLGGDDVAGLVCVDDVTEGGVFERTIQSSFDNLFALNVAERTGYLMYTDAEDCNIDTTDTTLRLINLADGSQVAYNDDIVSFDIACSRFALVVEPGNYLVSVGSYKSNATPYSLHVEVLPNLNNGDSCNNSETNEITGVCPSTDFCAINLDDNSGICTTRYVEGQACTSTDECADENYCFDDVCSTYPLEGEVCNTFEDYCPEGNYCTDITGDAVCSIYPVEGELCDSGNDQCQDETYCNFNTQLCTTYPVEGEVCNPFNDLCQGETYCYDCEGFDCDSTIDPICTTYPEIDDPCTRDNDLCPEGSYCGGNFFDGYLCTALPQLGDECSRSTDLCPEGAYCGGGNFSEGYFCVTYPVAGEACLTFTDECIDSTCVENGNNDTCVGEALAEGDRCAIEFGCPEGLECGTEIGSVIGQCITPICGDGFVSPSTNEECDDGNLEDNDGCDSACVVETSAIIENASFESNFYGALTLDDARWDRPSDTCSGGSPNRAYDVFVLTNNTDADVDFRISATFNYDGFLHVYDTEPNEADWTAGCLAGNDDLNLTLYGGDRSALNATVPANSSVYVVVSSWASATAFSPGLGAYTLSLFTAPVLREGDACEVDFPEDCENITSCQGNSTDGYFCVTRPILGEVCDSGLDNCLDSQCEGNFTDGYFCIAYPVAGEECSSFDDLCQGDTYCAGDFTNGYFCTPYPLLGEGCDQFDDYCVEGECIEDLAGLDVCTLVPNEGEICNPNDDRCIDSLCVGNSGEAGTCTVIPSAGGDVCDIDYGCFEGAFCETDGSDVGICIATVCGDGTVNGSEACDDGNLDNDDGCSAECVIEPNQTVTIDSGVIDLTFEGELTETDYLWARPSPDCFGGNVNRYYDFYEVTNTSDGDVSVTVTGSWNEYDGFLHIYSDANLSDRNNCITGNDDFGDAGQSRVASQLIVSGETIYIVASTYFSFDTGTYTITVVNAE